MQPRTLFNNSTHDRFQELKKMSCATLCQAGLSSLDDARLIIKSPALLDKLGKMDITQLEHICEFQLDDTLQQDLFNFHTGEYLFLLGEKHTEIANSILGEPKLLDRLAGSRQDALREKINPSPVRSYGCMV